MSAWEKSLPREFVGGVSVSCQCTHQESSFWGYCGWYLEFFRKFLRLCNPEMVMSPMWLGVLGCQDWVGTTCDWRDEQNRSYPVQKKPGDQNYFKWSLEPGKDIGLIEAPDGFHHGANNYYTDTGSLIGS